MKTGTANEKFIKYLLSEEKSSATIYKYVHDVNEMLSFIENKGLSKETLMEYRKHLGTFCKAQTVNGKLSAINAYLRFMGLEEYKIKFLKVQKKTYLDEKRELMEDDFRKLLQTAEKKNKMQLYYLMLVLYGTGIRISELPYVTVEAINQGKAEICMKGKYRVIIFPKKLSKKLKEYLKMVKIEDGCVFCTKSGKNWDRSNICHSLKKLCKEAGVETTKVFPHNFRHLFAKRFYAIEKDLAHLADLLGHSSIETTRIYVMASIKQYEKVLNKMDLGAKKQIPQNNHSVVLNSYI